MGAKAKVEVQASFVAKSEKPSLDGAGNKRRVLLVGDSLPLAMDRRTLHQAMLLRDAGFSPTVIAPYGDSDPHAVANLKGINLIGYPLSLSADSEEETRRLARREAQRLARMVAGGILNKGYVLVSLARPADTGLMAARMVRLLRKPLILDYRVPGPEALIERGAVPAGPAYRDALRAEHLLFAKADMVLCPSAAIQQLVTGRGGVARERVALFRDVPQPFIGTVQSLGAEWRRGRRHLVVFAGPVTRYAGIDLFVRAARRIVYGLDLTHIQFVIAGNGPHRRAIEDLVHAEGLKDYVTCVAGEDPVLVAGLLASADVAVDPTPPNALGREIASAVLADYMARGVSTVAFERDEAADYPADTLHLVREADIPGLAQAILQAVDIKPGLHAVPRFAPPSGDVGPVYTALVQRLIASRVPTNTSAAPAL